MYRGLCAVTAAAICAALFVGFVPPPGPAAAGIQPAQQATALTANSLTAIPEADIQPLGCAQAWPYYEASCLRDTHSRAGAIPVRVIAISKTAGQHVQR
jgi:hypothetical protein